MDLLNQTLELHQQLRIDFQRREAVIADQEAEARRILEEVLHKCEADRTAIQQERELLDGVEVVYRRFLDRQVRQSGEADHSAPALATGSAGSHEALASAPETKIETSNVGTNEVFESADAPWAARNYISEMASAITDFRAQRRAGAHGQPSDG